MRKFLIFFVFISLVSLGTAQVDYDISADSENLRVNTTILLDCSNNSQCPVNSWDLEWQIPEDAEITNLSDSQGAINDFSRTGDTIQIETNKAPKRKAEKLTFNYVMDSSARKIADGLHSWRVTISAFPDRSTTGSLEADGLLSGRVSEGFEYSYSNDSLSFRGQGPGEVLVNFGQGSTSDYYTFFGGEKNGSLAYKVSVGTTGFRQSYDSIPVVLKSDLEYETSVSPWSQGEYTAGVIKIRKDLEQSFQPVLAEETVHASNSEALKFDRTSSAWLDEGLGSYTQSMVRRKLEGPARMRQIFGNETSYIVERNGSRFRVTKPSTGNRDVLWNYYQEDRSFMKGWNPRKVDEEVRRFGYAYSELIIRNYVSNGNRVSDLYQKIETDQTLETNQEKWDYMSQYMDLTPCRFESRQRFNQCLNRINSYDYKVYSATKVPKVKNEPVEVEELETPNYTTPNSEQAYSGGRLNNQVSKASNLIDMLFDIIFEILYN